MTVEGYPDPETGLILNFDDLEAAVDERRKLLHQLLNDIEALPLPTLERISTWIWNRLANKAPGLAEAHLWRPPAANDASIRPALKIFLEHGAALA